MQKSYLLGVDGGNTKTDFVLFDTQGNLVDYLKTGSCSHEALADGYAGAKRELNRHITTLFERNKVSRNEIVSSVFGLAGIDNNEQQMKMTTILSELDFNHFLAINDSFLPIKAASRDGTGVCSINGTGSVTGGIDRAQRYLQVGGIGAAVGDSGGGRCFSERTIRAVYDELFRNGKATTMTTPLLELLNVTDDEMLMEAISKNYYGRKTKDLEFMKILFSSANREDEVAVGIVLDIATQLANSVIGCINRLDFGKKVNIVTAGSIWDKCETPLLYLQFCHHIQKNLIIDSEFVKPNLPPICGAVNWAFQFYEGVEQGCRRMEHISEEITRALS